MINTANTTYTFFRIRLIGLFLLLSTFFGLKTFAQGQDADSTRKTNQISISDIGFHYEDLKNILFELDENSQLPKSIIYIDSTYASYSEKIDSLKQKVIQDSSRYNLRLIKNLLNEWRGYKIKLFDWQLDISEHAHLLEAFQDTLRKRNEFWSRIYLFAKENEAPESIKQRITSAQDSISIFSESIRALSFKLVRIQENILSTINQVDQVIDHLELANITYTGQLFVLDSPPIWKWKIEKSTIDFYAETQANFADQERILQIFIKDHLSEFLFHSLSFIFLLVLFISVKKRYASIALPGDDYRLKMAFITIKNPFLAALTIGVILSMYFYTGAPDIVNYALIFLVLIPTLYFFPRYVKVHRMVLVYLLIVLFYIDKFQEMIVVDELLNRVLQLVKAISVLFILYHALKTQKTNKSTANKYWKSFVNGMIPFFILLIVVSLIANIFGAYQLSELLIEGILTSSLFAAIFVVSGIVASSLLVVILRSKYITSLKVFSKNSLKFENRITILTYLFVSVLWLRITLNTFQLLDPVKKLYEGFLDLSWAAGSVTISVGGIISFFFILIVTFLIARLLKELINDQIISVKKSAKGLPNAFSMVFRYMVVTLGVYIALAAVGINLSEFGLMAGALGVGLGFGLQNILHNLVSGLIVSFERPIHVGDTVEVANLMGIVTEIGVRSSKIRTYEGSEVILPNGDLLSKQVINWTLSDQKRRLEIKVRSSFDADPHEVLEILNKVIKSNERILTDPGPMCLFEGYGDSALNFKVLFWVPLDIGLTTKSQVALSIYDKLKEKNIEAPIHQQRLLYQDSSHQNKPM
ncbi:MAG: mechanosensitive ion channel [Bacteroidales bacterium]|nr:mechanosensitive ion channel [Bacteroidales bacterium]